MLNSDYGQRFREAPMPRIASCGKPLRPAANSFRKTIEEFSFVSTDLVGSGLTSKVYRGLNDQTGEVVCVKMIDMRKQECVRFKDMLKSEIALLRELHHANIVELKQVYHTTNNCYIITEYCEGGDVAGHLKSKLRLTEQQAVGLLRDLLSAYQYLVNKNILHRDIKPANTFLTADGTLKLADFGFAIRTDNCDLARLNVGSPVYMAPECLEKSQYSFRSDIFAIGVFYYELLHGYTPWPCRSEEELLRRIYSEPLRFSSNCSMSEASKDFLTKCLKINKSERMSEKQIFSHQLVATSKRSSGTTTATENNNRSQDSPSEITMAMEEYQLKPQQRPRKKKKQPTTQQHQRNPSIADRLKTLQASKDVNYDAISQRKISIQQSLKTIMQSTQLKLQSPSSARSLKRLDLIASVPSLVATDSAYHPTLRRISKQAQPIATDRHRINSEAIESQSTRVPFRQHRLQSGTVQTDRVKITVQTQLKIAGTFERTFQLISQIKDEYYFKRLLEKIAFLICRIDQLLNGCTRTWHNFQLEEDDPYLKSVLKEANIKEVCRVGEFYFRRMTRMLNQSLMSRKEGTPPNRRDSLNTLTTLTGLVNRIQAVMDCIINGQEVIAEDNSRAQFFS